MSVFVWCAAFILVCDGGIGVSRGSTVGGAVYIAIGLTLVWGYPR